VEHSSLVEDGFPTWDLVPRPGHTGPREDWFCGCTGGQGNVLRPALMDHCGVCKVAAPWMAWQRKDVGV
jgi:hypothetical protein